MIEYIKNEKIRLPRLSSINLIWKYQAFGSFVVSVGESNRSFKMSAGDYILSWRTAWKSILFPKQILNHFQQRYMLNGFQHWISELLTKISSNAEMIGKLRLSGILCQFHNNFQLSLYSNRIHTKPNLFYIIRWNIHLWTEITAKTLHVFRLHIFGKYAVACFARSKT